MAIGTREALIDAAENLMRTRGYAAFSYADLSEKVGIRKASIHHHFPTKEELGVAIVEKRIAEAQENFERIEADHRAVAGRLEAFLLNFRANSEGGFLPLCGALAAEMTALPSGLQTLTKRFFDLQLKWLTTMVERGIENGEIPCGRGARKKAFLLLSALEGASFVNWATGERDSLDSSIVRLIIEEP